MTKTLLLGLDGATFTVLDPLTRPNREGQIVMPFLKTLMENGVRAKLRSTPNPLTPPAWVSLMTGRSPGHHGVFDFLRAEEKKGEVYFTLSDARDIRTETLWSIASRQKRGVVALNFPITAPPRETNGSVVPGFVPWKHLRRNVRPPGLFDRLKNIPGFDPKELAWDFEQEKKAMDVMGKDEVEQWVKYHLPREEQWFRIAEMLLSQDQPEMMAVMFDGTDKIQHQAWIFLNDDLISDQDDPWVQRMREVCRSYFRALDGFLQRLVELAPEAQVFLASDHGFTASTEVVRINCLLEDMGYLSWRKEEDSEAERRRDKSWFANLDWNNTTAYCRTPSSNGITIRTTESGGAGVSPQEYEVFRDELIAKLEAVTDPASGERIFTEIHKREDIFSGPAMKDAPDITLVLRDFGFVSIANQRPAIEPRPVPIGTHHPDGIFIAHGPGIKAGEEIARRNIIDVTSTLLYSLGLSIPNDFEGEVVEDFFTVEQLAQRPISIGSPTLSIADGVVNSGSMSDDDKENILEQLKMLGYME